MPNIDNEAEINALLTKEMGVPLVTKWLVLVELIDEDGDRKVGYLSSDNCAPWDEMGLLEYHRQYRESQWNEG